MDINTVSEKTSTTSNHLDSLLTLRGVACFMGVISHCNAPRKAIFYKNLDLTWLTFSFGFVGVWIFFCLSGYLSYGIYVWHLPIIHKSIPAFSSNVPIEAFYLRLTTALVLSTGLAAVTYYFWLKFRQRGGRVIVRNPVINKNS